MSLYRYMRKCLWMAFALGMLLATNTVAAVIEMNPDSSVILTGSNGLISVTEEYMYGDVSYTVDILDEASDISISIFGVSSNTSALGASQVWSSRDGWSAIQLDAAGWNEGYSVGTFNTLNLGLFDSFFSGDLYVNLYMNSTTLNNIMAASDEISEFGFRNSFVDSNFVALSGNGAIISQSLGGANVSVPEPSTIVILGLGLAGLVFSRKKKVS